VIRTTVDLAQVPAWQVDPERHGFIRVHLGTVDPITSLVEPLLTVMVDAESADKARQIGALLIAAAEQLEPTGLELVRANR
jgi:hypothetical protein